MEERLLARFDEFGHRFLTHHDVKPENMILGSDGGPVTVLDWTSARMSVPGTGLRILAGSGETRRRRVAFYLECMERLGHRLDARDILLAVTAQQGFAVMHRGIMRKDIARIEAGADMLIEAAAML